MESHWVGSLIGVWVESHWVRSWEYAYGWGGISMHMGGVTLGGRSLGGVGWRHDNGSTGGLTGWDIGVWVESGGATLNGCIGVCRSHTGWDYMGGVTGWSQVESLYG